MTGQHIVSLEQSWTHARRWEGIRRPYSAADVFRLRGSLHIDHTLASKGAETLWRLFNDEPYIRALGAMTGNQAVQQVRAGLKAIYVSGWQVAADANDADQMYPDLSLYPANSVPRVVRKINNALLRADQIQSLNGQGSTSWYVPIVADGEAGFGGMLNAFEVMQAMIEAGAGAVHFEDQASSLKKCGHMGGKVLVPTNEFITKLTAARLASDVLGVPTVLIARTDARSAKLLQSDADPADHSLLTGERTTEGYHVIRGGMDLAIQRALAYAPLADVLWCETSTPDLGEAREFAEAIHDVYPKKYLAYNCSPSFNWKRKLSDSEIARFQDELGLLGYKFQFVTLAGFHALNASMFSLSREYALEGMPAFVQLQEHEFSLEREYGYLAAKHQSFVGASYFDAVQQAVLRGESSTAAMSESTESEQFREVR